MSHKTVASPERLGMIRRVKAVRDTALVFGMHGATWCGVLVVIAVFAHLDLNWSRQVYLERHRDAWHGGVRLGFPMCCWDAGQASKATAEPGRLVLQVRDYGGWRWLGVANDFVIFSITVAAVALALERGRRALVRRHGLLHLPAVTAAAPAVQPITASSPSSWCSD